MGCQIMPPRRLIPSWQKRTSARCAGPKCPFVGVAGGAFARLVVPANGSNTRTKADLRKVFIATFNNRTAATIVGLITDFPPPAKDLNAAVIAGGVDAYILDVDADFKIIAPISGIDVETDAACPAAVFVPVIAG